MTRIALTPSPVSVLEGGSGILNLEKAMVDVVNTGNTDYDDDDTGGVYCGNIDNFVRCFWVSDILTQQEVTITRKYIIMAIESLLEIEYEMKDYREALWQNCNPEDPETRDAFDEMNRVKTKLRKLKKEKGVLSEVLRKLKQQGKIC